MEIVSRQEALVRGLKFYFTGKPCSRGHIAERYAYGGCTECVRSDARKYRAENKERVKEADKRYRAQNRQKILERRRIYNFKNRDALNRLKLEWARNNPDKVAASRDRWLDKEEGRREREKERISAWRKENPEKMRLARIKYKKENPEKAVEYQAARRARKLNSTPPWYGELDDFVMQEAADLCRVREAVFGFPWHVDHMVPLRARKACGLHCAANIQVIPAVVNLVKNNKLLFTEPFTWMS